MLTADFDRTITTLAIPALRTRVELSLVELLTVCQQLPPATPGFEVCRAHVADLADQAAATLAVAVHQVEQLADAQRVLSRLELVAERGQDHGL